MQVWLSLGNGQSRTVTPEFADTGSGETRFGDLDGDGDLDAGVANRLHAAPLVLVQEVGHLIWLNDGEGQFRVSDGLCRLSVMMVCLAMAAVWLWGIWIVTVIWMSLRITLIIHLRSG
ncbi:MAG: hypothetical protein M2R45_01729 [Verrucomicrobia subdivision 3 bacterium]|nr:hypothetical protein [Limisphaerales bacterium]MCS1413466.1 hypothetical protein [Limisphaerales bacterium]